MLFKNINLYINEKNITSIQPFFSSSGVYGLDINGIKYEFGRCMNADKNNQAACLGKMKALQTQLIKKIEK